MLLSARRVGPGGFAYGVDMTDEMLDAGPGERGKAGATNVEFRKGTIEDVPLPDASVDVVISNCVINLSMDKPAVLAEMFRVLKPRRADRGQRCRRRGPAHPADTGRARALRRVHRGRPVPRGVPRRPRRRRLPDATVTFTHEAAGMHAAIIRAVKPRRRADGEPGDWPARALAEVVGTAFLVERRRSAPASPPRAFAGRRRAAAAGEQPRHRGRAGALILALQPVSAAFNPVVTLVESRSAR